MSSFPGSSVLLSVLFAAALASGTSGQGHVRRVDDGVFDQGAVFAIDLGASFGLETQSELSQRAGTVPGPLDERGAFGSALTSLGDVDGNGAVDLAVGARGDGVVAGSVRILFRNTDGSVSSVRTIRPDQGGFDPSFTDNDQFGAALANLGDLDGNGVDDLAVGAPGDVFEPSPTVTGHVWILFLNPDGSVSSTVRIDGSHGGFTGALDVGDSFGAALAALGDLDGDGVAELGVGAPGDDDGSSHSGALWILYMDAAGTVKSTRKISTTSGGFTGASSGEGLGSSVAPIGDLDQDGQLDLALGAVGAVWILFLNADETVRTQKGLSPGHAGLFIPIYPLFGASAAPIGDINGDGTPDLVVGATGYPTGQILVLLMKPTGAVLQPIAISTAVTGLEIGDGFGSSIANLGDLDGDGRPDLAVGAAMRDGANGADFTSLSAAIAAAVDGDVLLLERGGYSGIDIGAKSLTLQGDRNSFVGIGEASFIHDLVPGQSVRLRGLHLGPLELDANAGLVWIEDCVVPSAPRQGEPGLRIDGCTDVVLLTSSFAGQEWNGTPDSSSPVAGHGLLISGASSVQAYDCTFRGADADLYAIPFFPSVAPQTGGSGVISSAAGDFVFLAGCEASGGSGTSYSVSPFSPTTCTSGGAGLRVAGHAVVLDSLLTGGPGGLDVGVPCAPPGPNRAGQVQGDPGTATSLSMPSPVHENETFSLEVHGPPNAMIFLQTGANPTAVFSAPLSGSVLVRPPIALEYLGNTNGDGRYVTQRTVGLLPPSFTVGKVFFQVFYIDASGPVGTSHVRSVGKVLGAGSMVVVLDGPP